jgi:hypothetical protein
MTSSPGPPISRSSIPGPPEQSIVAPLSIEILYKTRAGPDRVTPATAQDGLDAVVALDFVVARSGSDEVVASTGADEVVPSASVDYIDASEPDDDVAPARTLQFNRLPLIPVGSNDGRPSYRST